MIVSSDSESNCDSTSLSNSYGNSGDIDLHGCRHTPWVHRSIALHSIMLCNQDLSSLIRGRQERQPCHSVPCCMLLLGLAMGVIGTKLVRVPLPDWCWY